MIVNRAFNANGTDGTYYYNPCYSFTLSGDSGLCKDVAVSICSYAECILCVSACMHVCVHVGMKETIEFSYAQVVGSCCLFV